MKTRVRLHLALPAAVLCAIAGLGFHGAFDLGDIVLPSVLAAVLPSAMVALAAWAADRKSRRFPPFAVGAAAVGWLTVLPLTAIWIAGAHGGGHRSLGSFVMVLRSALTDGTRQLLSTTSPAQPTAVLLTTAGTCVWWAAVWTAVLALRGTPPLLVLLPPTILLGLGTAASAGSGDPGTVATAAAFLVAALLFVGVDQATRERPADTIAVGDRGARGGAALRTSPFFAGVTVLALLAAAVAPHLPGLPQRRPWDPRTLVAPADQPFDETDPLTQAVAWLKGDASAPLFTVTAGSAGAAGAADQRLRWQVLDAYDGRHWSSSAQYRPAGKTLPAGDAVSAPAGPSVTVQETVHIENLSSAFLPATGRVRTVSGAEVRVDPSLGMIATGDGRAAAASLSYHVDTTVPVLSDEDRLRAAPAGSGGALERLRSLPPNAPDNLTAFAATAATGDTPYDQMRALAAAVRDAFGYDPDAAAGQSFGRISTLVAYGKDTDQRAAASADAFATLFAVSARQIGYPARLVVGFAPGTEDGAGSSTVSGPDVRVWPEVYFAGVGWVPFYDAVPDGKGSGDGDSPIHQQPTGAPSTEPTDVPSAASAPYSGPSVQIDASKTHHGGSVLAVLLGVLAAVAVAALVGAVLLRVLLLRRRRAARRADPDPRRRIQWAWLESLEELGVGVRTTATPSELARTAPSVLGEEGAEPIRRLAGLAETAAYAPEVPEAEQADRAWEYAEQIRVLSRRQTPRRVRVLRLLRPPAREARRH